MSKVGNNANGYLYLIVDTMDELPVYVADTFREAQAWLQVSSATLSKMLDLGDAFPKLTLYKDNIKHYWIFKVPDLDEELNTAGGGMYEPRTV